MSKRTRLALAGVAALALGVVSSVVVAWSIALAIGEGASSRAKVIALPKPRALLSVSEGASLGRRSRMIWYLDHISGKITDADLAAKHAEWAQRPESAGGGRRDWPDSWLAWGDLHRTTDELVRRRQSAFGFPLVCLWYERSGGLSMFGSAARLHGGYEITRALGRQRSGMVAEAALALRPIWLGLIANTLLYSLAWFGAISLVARWRRRRLRRRGVCHACKYNLAGIPAGAPCPECGAKQPE